MKIVFLYLAGLLLFATKCNAQINESDTVHLQLRLSITGNYQAGNVEVLTLKSKLDAMFLPAKNIAFKSQNNSLYQAFYSKEADNDIFSRNYLYYKPQRKIYPFAIGYISANFRRKIDHRWFAGTGVTWQAVNTGSHVLKVSVSAVYEATRFTASAYNYHEYDGDNRIKLWRATLYIGGWIYPLKRYLRLYYDAFWQPAFNTKKNYRTQADIGADFPAWKGLSFNAVLSYTHEQVVVTNIQQNDKILTFGMAYNFRKK